MSSKENQLAEAKAALDEITPQFQYFTSEINRVETAHRVADKVIWAAQNPTLALLAPDLGGRIPAQLFRKLHGLFFPDVPAPLAVYCNLNPLIDLHDEYVPVVQRNPERTDEALDRIGAFAARQKGISFVVEEMKKPENEGKSVILVDNTIRSGKTLHVLTHALLRNGVPDNLIKWLTASPYNQIPLAYADIFMHRGFPKEAYGVVKGEEETTAIRPAPPEVVKVRREVALWAAEYWLKVQVAGLEGELEKSKSRRKK